MVPESAFVKEDIMPGSLNDILPEPISPENEAVLLDLLLSIT